MNAQFVDLQTEHWSVIVDLQKQAYDEALLEQAEVLQGKAKFVGHMCKAIIETDGSTICGYLLAHPWKPNDAPSLDSLVIDEQGLGLDYTNYKHIFLHDFALGNALRGKGLALDLIQTFLEEARSKGFETVSLVAVQGSDPFWNRFGFKADVLSKDLSLYGSGACFMSLKLKD